MRTAIQAAEALDARAAELRAESRHAAALKNNDDANVLALTAHNLTKVAAEVRDASVRFWLDADNFTPAAWQ